MNIPDEAVEAAHNAIIGGDEATGPDIAVDFLTREQVTRLLEAATPHLLAEGWDDAATAIGTDIQIDQRIYVANRIRQTNPYRSRV